MQCNNRLPHWLRQKLPNNNHLKETRDVLCKNKLSTVCEEAKCPNRLECFSKKTATFLALGNTCTRSCAFCGINSCKTPAPPNPKEPQNIAQATKELKLQHVVITMVTRDDLSDGGAQHIANIIKKIQKNAPQTAVEVLTSDFQENYSAIDLVLEAEPNIFNHNIETTKELTKKIRSKASYERSLQILQYVKTKNFTTKSGLMLGLGETPDQIKQTLQNLANIGCDIVTIGQYLRPSKKQLPIKEFIKPEQFKFYEEYGLSLGIKKMHCGPFVRSSYNANKLLSWS